MPIVAVTDYTFPELEIEEAILRPLGAEVRGGRSKEAAAVSALVRDADVVITQFATLDATVIGSMERARAIVRYGIGTDNVDLEAARSRGIPVCNVPDYCIDEVADHTLALMLAVTRQVVRNATLIREGSWGLATPLEQMRTLHDQTVGILGFGRIGRAVQRRLAGFQCPTLVFDAFVAPETIRATGCEPVSFNELLARSDIVSLHCPSTPETRRLINAASLNRMKPGAVVINLARGDLVETGSLIAALESGRIGAAAIDVCDPEPIPLDSPLRTLPNVIATSHIASTSARAVRTLRETVASIAATALRGQPLPNIVNGLK